uniref:G2/M phase-specific E3 ubiquitin-protein ligase n=1 Tax=Otus sunia TaxID=257818 RepID=A0A8C8B5H9_9STRI
MLSGSHPDSSGFSSSKQALGDNPSRTFPPAPQRCSFPTAFALSLPACVLCGRAAADPDLCGRKLEKQGLCAHLFCLVSAPRLPPQQNKELGLMGFLPEDIRRTVEQAAQKQCFVCGESGATITCFQKGCDRSFHLPCAVEGECVTQYLPQSFCREHRPEQEVEAAPEDDTICIICLEPVEDRKSYHTMVCPACKHAWFHRGCIQGQASCACISFTCPLCRDRDLFLLEMLIMGIRIPVRLPSWENQEADRALIQRHQRCDARECLCPGGRQQAEEQGPWQLLLCSSCAAEGTHRRCCNSRTVTASWECESCAGQGTGKRQSTQVPLGWGQGLAVGSQAGLAKPLCSRRAGGTALASPALKPGGRARDLPTYPYSLH